jgi:sugar/nucleoside kinase (ribokinase family)
MRERQRLPGGQIATAVLGCARLGHRTALLTSVGDDAEAELALAPLRGAGVDLTRVRAVAGAATRSAWIWVDAGTGERTVLWQRDERLALGPEALARADVASARVVLVDATDLALSLHAAQLARAEGRPCVVDADAPQPGLRGLLACASHPVISQPLACALFGSAETALGALARAGAEAPVVTCGRDGALAWIGGAVERVPAFAVEARDTTGAGDAFHAGIVHGLLEGVGGAALLRIASAAAACACRAAGAQAGLPTRSELAAFLANPPPAAADG